MKHEWKIVGYGGYDTVIVAGKFSLPGFRQICEQGMLFNPEWVIAYLYRKFVLKTPKS